ncbi:MAG: D-alanine--D-alanine ligase family protein [Ignavibacteria bacterium]
MKSDSKVLICYNAPLSIFPYYNGKASGVPAGNNLNDVIDLSESGFSREIGNIKKILSGYFLDVKIFTINSNIEQAINKINSYSPDIIFNFVESIEGISNYEYCIAALFELLGYQFTGSPPICLGNCLDKGKTKKILQSHKVKTPEYIVASCLEKFSIKNFPLSFPVILKLLTEDASIGISEFSVVNNLKELKTQVDFLFSNYHRDVIIEEYIDGRELNAAILGGKILPISEILFDGLPDNLPKIVTYDGKWMSETIYYENTKPSCPANLDKVLKKSVEETAIAAFNAMGCRDYARVDIRLNRENVPYVIEVNPNPDISIDSGFARAAAAAGLSYAQLLTVIADFALTRKKYDSQIKAS